MLKLHIGVKQRDIDIALLHAIKVSFTECAEVLLSSGANADSRDAYDNTPLALACEAGSVTITKMLLDAGATVNLHTGSRGTALHKAANWGYADCVKLLLEHAASPNVQDGLWRTPLMLAVMHAPQADFVIRLLIDAGCDVKATGVEQKTALHHAAERGLDNQIPILLGAGADLYAVDASRNTALHSAALYGHARVIASLLKAGCSASAVNYQLRTCLHLAAIKGDVACISLLHEAYINAQEAVDATGYLPVWYAVNGGHYEATIFFVRANCRLHPDGQQQHPLPAAEREHDSAQATNPLTMALEKRFMRIARVLLIGGCDASPLNDWLVALPQNTWTDENFAHIWWLTSYIQNPLDLLHLSRLVVRQCLGIRLLMDLDRLPLPKGIQQFVSMNELLDLEFGTSSELGTSSEINRG